MKKSLPLKAFILVFLSTYDFSLATTEVISAVPHRPDSVEHRAPVRERHTMSPKSIDPKEVGNLFMRVVDDRESPDLLLTLGWNRLPIAQNEDIDGLSEDYLLEGYKKIYFLSEERKNIEDAARALFYGSQVQQYSEGLFSSLLKDLGIDTPKPTLDNIKGILRSKLSK
jgi:hypothetical protein